VNRTSAVLLAMMLVLTVLPYDLTLPQGPSSPFVTCGGESGAPGDTGTYSGDGKPVYENSGDWIIESGDHVQRSGEHIILNGDLIIEEGGSLELENCDLRFNATEDGGYGIAVEGSLEAAGCSLLSASSHTYYFETRGHLRLNDTRVEDMWGSGKPYVGGIQCYTDDIFIESCIIANNTRAGIFAGANITVRDTEFYGNFIAVAVNNGSRPMFYNSYFHNQQSRDVYVRNSSLPTFVNSTTSFTKEVADAESGAAIAWYLSIYVTLKNGVLVSGVDVHVEDTYTGTQKADAVTDENGAVMDLQLLEKIVRKEGKKDDVFSNYRIDIEKYGVDNSLMVYDMDESMSVYMNLTGDYFGTTAVSGDFNADGFMDLAASAPGNLTGGEGSGAVFVFLGDASTLFRNLRESDADMALFGDTGEDFGAALGAGDINGDGYDDLVVGAPGNDDNAKDSGAAYIFYGRDGLSAGDWNDRTDAVIVLKGRGENQEFGIHVDASGDVNGDGFADVSIGSGEGLHIYHGSGSFVGDFSRGQGGSAKAKGKGASDTTGEPLADIKNNDASGLNDAGYYEVDPPEDGGRNKLNLVGFDTTGMFGSITGVTLQAAYITDRYYSYYSWERSWVQWRIGGGDWQNSFMPREHRSEHVERFDLFGQGVDTFEEIENLEIYFENIDGTGGGSSKHYIQFDYIWISVTAEAPGANVTLPGYAGGAAVMGDVNNDSHADILMPGGDGYRLYYGSGNGITLGTLLNMDNPFDFNGEWDNVSRTREGIEISPEVAMVPDGTMEDGWDHWTFRQNSQGHEGAEARIIDDQDGDWKPSPLSGGPTLGYGTTGSYVNNGGGHGSGAIASSEFVIPDNLDSIHLWHYWKIYSFDNGEGARIQLWEHDGDDWNLLETVREWFAPTDSTDYETPADEEEIIFDVAPYRGKNCVIYMETIGGDGQYDESLFEIDDVYGLTSETAGYGNFTSETFSLERNLTGFMIEMDRQLNNGSLEMRLRANSSIPWENAVVMVPGTIQALEGHDGRTARELQYRLSFRRGDNESSPVVSGLSFILYLEGDRVPVEITGDFDTAAMGDFDGDGPDDIALSTVPGGVVHVFHGRDDLPGNMSAADADLVIDGSIDGDGDFGHSLSFLRDTNDDGMEELLIGSPSEGAGKVYEFYGRTGQGSLGTGDADRMFAGESPGDRYGEFLYDNVVTTPYHAINTGRIYFLPVHRYDAGITGLSMDRDPWPGGVSGISCIVGNYGIENLSSVDVTLDIISPDNLSYGHTEERAVDLSGLETFETSTLDFDWDVPGGEGIRYTVTFTIDYPPDLNPLNNRTSLEVLSRYHAVVLSAAVEDNSSHAGDPTVFPLTVTNSGNMGNDTISLQATEATVPDEWQVRFLVDGGPVTDVTLAPGESAPVVLEIVSPDDEESGIYPIEVKADSDSGLAGSKVTVNVTVLRPDLEAVGFELYREDGAPVDNLTVHGVANENITFVVHIRNVGDTYSDPFDLTFFTDRGTVGGAVHGRLEEGDMVSVEIIVMFADEDIGNFTITCDVDPGSQVYELAEDNNRITFDLELWDDLPDSDITLRGYLYDLNGDPVSNGSVELNNQAGGHMYDVLTGADGQYNITVAADEFRDADLFKLTATDGVFSTTEFFYLYSEDGGEYWLNLTLKEYRISLSSPDNRERAAPGETVNYTVKIENLGSTTAFYRIDIRDVPAGWAVSLEHPSLTGSAAAGYRISLERGETASMTLSVTLSAVMEEAVSGVVANISLTAASEDFSFVRDTLYTETEVLPVSSVLFDPGVTGLSGRIGEPVRFNITAVNTGNLREYVIPLADTTPSHNDNIGMEGFTDYLDLPVNASVEFILVFVVPDGIAAGNTIDIELRSHRDNSNIILLTVTVEESSSVDLSGVFEYFAEPGENISFPITLENTGNRLSGDTFFIDAVAITGGDAEVYLDRPVLDIPHSGQDQLTVSVVPGLRQPVGNELTITLEITSGHDPEFLQLHDLVLTMEGHHLVYLSLEDTGPEIRAYPLYGLFNYTLMVENAGNLPADVRFVIEGTNAGWVETPGTIELAEFAREEIQLTVRVPTGSDPDDRADVTITPYVMGVGGISEGALQLGLGAGEEFRGLGMTLLENRTLSTTRALYRIQVTNEGEVYETLEFHAYHEAYPGSWQIVSSESVMNLAPGETTVVEVIVTRPTSRDKWQGDMLAALRMDYSETPVASLELPKQPIGKITPLLEPPYLSLEDILLNGSTDAGTIVNYIWDMGDGTMISGGDKDGIIHKYGRSGSYTVTLRSVDASGLYDESTLTISVENEEPEAVMDIFPDNTTIYAGTVLRFSAGNSWDRDGDVVAYMWEFGSMGSSGREWVEWKFDFPGTHTITLVVEDNMGASSRPEKKTINVIARPVPPPDKEPTSDGGEDETILFLGNLTGLVIMVVLIGITVSRSRKRRTGGIPPVPGEAGKGTPPSGAIHVGVTAGQQMPTGEMAGGKKAGEKSPAGTGKSPVGKGKSKKKGIRCTACRTVIIIEEGSDVVECSGCGKRFRLKKSPGAAGVSVAETAVPGDRAGTRRCIACGAEVPGGFRFCNKCGFEFTETSCPACGADVPGGFRFCNKCGFEFSVTSCSACGADVPGGFRFCNKCGAPMEKKHP